MNTEVSKLRVELLLKLSELSVQKRQLERIKDHIRNIEVKLELLESCPDKVLFEERLWKEYEEKWLSRPVSPIAQLMIQ